MASKKKNKPKQDKKRASGKKGSSGKKRSKAQAPSPKPLLTPSEGQKVKLAVVLLVVFLAGFSLATGALEVGRWEGNTWHLSAVDTRGQCRMKFVVSLNSAPRLTFFDGSGREWRPVKTASMWR